MKMMNIGYQNTNRSRHPKRLFSPASEAYISILPMCPRYMELPRGKPSAKRPHAVRAGQKGAAPC